MNIQLQPARVPGGGVFSVQEVPYAASQTFKRGAVLNIASGQVQETSPLTAGMTSLYGVALQGANTNPGQDASNSPTVITGLKKPGTSGGVVSIAKFDAISVFEALLYNGATQQATEAQLLAAVGNTYGLTKLAAGNWVVDMAKTGTSAYVTVQGYDKDTQTVRFKFVQSAVVA